MKNLPFSIFKRADRPCYLVSFKNDETGKYLPAISTRRKTESEAIKIAFAWLRDGIPSKEGYLNVKQYSLRDMAKSTDITKADAVFICKELQRRGLLKSYVLEKSVQATDFVSYLIDFWNWEKSPYIKEKLRRNHGLHKRYAIEMTGTIKKYWEPFFKGKILGEITRQDIENFIAYLESLPEQAQINKAFEKRQIIRFPKSAKRKNSIIQAGKIPLTWAFQKEMIDKDVTSGIVWFSGKSKERQILSPEQAKILFSIDWKDERSRLANMLAMVTGIRAGEIQGLRVQDLGKDCLYIRHSWNFMDGLKTTKNNECRIVEVPFPAIIHDLLNLAERNPHGASMDSFVFWAELSADKPMEAEIFRRDLRAALINTGMSKESAMEYTFHGWRHYFTAYMRDRVNEKLLQSQTGHKTLAMLEHYSDHLIAGDRERIRQAQIESFGSLIPSRTNT